jgi:hypothetical protein
MAKQLSQLQKAYQLFFRQKLLKYHVTSPAKIKDKEKKKEFFNEVKNDWQKRRNRTVDKEKIKGKYYNQYIRCIKRRFNIPKGNLESGMLVELRYYTRNKTTKKPNPVRKYLVLILHPNYKKYIHCLRLDNVKPLFFKRLYEKTGIVTCDYNSKCERLNVKQLLLEQKDAKKFYIKELRPKMKLQFGKSYRTFKYSQLRISSLYFFDFTKI